MRIALAKNQVKKVAKPIEPTRILLVETLHGGQMWSRIVRRGQALRITNTTGRSTPAALFYNPRQPLERYNMPDTLKCQHIARITIGNCLYSDMGRIFFSVIEDSYGWHDTITGHMTRAQSERKFGQGSYLQLRNSFHRNTRDNFLVELGKYGLGKPDLVPNVNFFAKIVAGDAGQLSWASDARPGDYIDLRAEMDTLLILSNTPHPMDPGPVYAPSPLELTLWQAPEPGPDDLCRNSRPENRRGFALTEDYHL